MRIEITLADTIIIPTSEEEAIWERWGESENAREQLARQYLSCACGAADCATARFEYRLGRNPDTYKNQKPYNYREAAWALRLHEREHYRLCDLVYENFRVCTNGVPKGVGPTRRGTQKVRLAFNDRFFVRMQELYDANRPQLVGRSGRIVSAAKWHVDVFGAHPGRRECGFWEVKRPKEERSPAQEYLLAFVRYLADTDGASVMRGEWHVRTDFIRYGGEPEPPITVAFEDPSPTDFAISQLRE